MSEQDYNLLMAREEGASLTDIGKGKILMQCLDKSGSMGGAPMTALHLGASQIGQTILSIQPADHRPFEKFITMPYDTRISGEFTATDLDSYLAKIKTINASGSTNFKAVF